MKKLLKYFSVGEIALWLSSVAVIIISFCIFDRESYLTLAASIVGVTALIICAKGNPIGQVFMIIFCILYGIISLSFSYYGELITYTCMSLPMAVFSLISWLRNPYKGERAEVKTNRPGKKEIFIMLGVTAVVTFLFYFILKYFGTANLLPSTLSVTTSFFAAYLSFRRSPYFAFVYALNDIVLIILWTLAAFTDITYISVIICFTVFLVNDLHGFFSWKRMEKRQRMPEEP
ncbi:MAG: nicotinamide mononucleotide transporter [Clostridia bacterium]|nr:nicotinamide mononucleotide transporter [Clostridia bacterium]